MKFRAIRSESAFFLLPSIFFTLNKSIGGHYEIGFVMFNWYLCVEWAHEN
jgi:hypothetical protein